MALTSFRVDDKLKKRMERMSHLNWSEVLREYAAKVVDEEEARKRPRKDYAGISKAVGTIDTLRSKSQSGWNGAEEIRKWRRQRH